MSAHQQGVIFNSTLSVSAARMAQAASWLMITTCPPLITGSKWFLKKKYHFYKEVFVSFHGEEIQRVQYVTTLMLPLLCIPAKVRLSYRLNYSNSSAAGLHQLPLLVTRIKHSPGCLIQVLHCPTMLCICFGKEQWEPTCILGSYTSRLAPFTSEHKPHHQSIYKSICSPG